MKRETRRALVPLCLACALAAAPVAPAAVTLQWGGAVWDSIFTSDGTSFDTPGIAGGFTFELGAFVDGFTPTEANVGTWGDNWVRVDTFTFGADPNFLVESSFDGTGTDSGGGSVDVVGDTAFVWGYNTQTAPQPGTEYVLYTGNGGGFSSPTAVTNDWVYPADGGQQTLLMEWRVSTTGTNSAVFGGIDFPEEPQGPGVVTDTPSSFSIQTHTFVPEPGSALLASLAGCVLLLRRRRG